MYILKTDFLRQQVLVYLKSLVVVPDTYYNYWTNPNSIVKTKSPEKIQDSIYTKNKTMNFLKKHNVNLDHYHIKLKKFKILGLTVLKKKIYKNKVQYILFNHIKFELQE